MRTSGDWDKNGNRRNPHENEILEFLYGSHWGRILLRPLISPWVSKAGGRLLDSSLSRAAVAPFIRRHGVDLRDYEKKVYRSFNDFFTRQIRHGKRLVCGGPRDLISPCDGKISVYPIGKRMHFKVKHTWYSVGTLLRNPRLAARYADGVCVVIRLSVEDYHRYCYVDSGHKGKNHVIPGKFHTVRPISGDYVPVYKENTRVYTTLYTEHFGPVIQMEVGALLVGRIRNYHGECDVKKGQEKGRFEFGGSTVILLLQKDRVCLNPILLENTLDGLETPVKMGQVLGSAKFHLYKKWDL